MKHFIEELDDQSRFLKSISHPARLAIIKILLEIESCSVNDMKDKLELPQSTVSQHLQIMRSTGVVKGDKQGTTVLYSIDKDGMKDFINLLDNIA